MTSMVVPCLAMTLLFSLGFPMELFSVEFLGNYSK